MLWKRKNHPLTLISFIFIDLKEEKSYFIDADSAIKHVLKGNNNMANMQNNDDRYKNMISNFC